MSAIKLLVRQGGGTSAQPDLANLVEPREGIPIFDESGRPIVDMAQRWEMGQAAQGSYTYIDVDGSSSYFHRAHSEVKLIESESGTDYVLAWGRMEGGNDTDRGIPKAGHGEVQHTSIQVMDCNMDLRGLPFRAEWDRPAETTWQRLEALAARSLNGSSSTGSVHRRTTVITVQRVADGHLVDASSPVDMDANTYPVGTTVTDVMEDIFSQWEGKRWGVTLHHDGSGTHKCLLVLDPDDNTSFASALKISDHLADWDPDDSVAPVLEPRWMRGAGKTTDTVDVISGLISIYGGTDEDPHHLYVATTDPDDDWDTWADVYYDDKAKNETQATRRANAILADRKRPYVTPQPTIRLTPEQTTLITAGQSIQVKSVVINQGADRATYQWWRIVEIRWEPLPDGNWLAHLQLGRARGAGAANGGGGRPQPGATTPEPPPDCIPTGTDNETILSSTDANPTDWPGGVSTGGTCWGGTSHMAMGASGGQSSLVTVTAGETIFGRVEVRDETGNDAWENVSNYAYVAYLEFEAVSGLLPVISHEIVAQLYHNVGCMAPQTHQATAVVPTGYDRARVRWRFKLGGIQYRGWIGESDPAEVPDNDEFCLPAGTGGSSPYFARSDDPRFTNDDQHLITKIQQRVINNTGATLQVGDIVVPDITQDDPSVTFAAGASLTDSMVGIVTTAGGDGETVVVLWQGTFLLPLNSTGTPTPGDYLYTSATDGAVDPSGTRHAGAVAEVIATDTSDNTTYVTWWGIPDTATSGSGSNGWFNVLDYGAVGDGTTNDTSAINDAIAAYNAAGGGVLYFPEGHYQTTGSLTSITAGGLILGDGHAHRDGTTQAVSRIDCSSTSASLFTIAAHATTIRGLALVQDSAGAPSGGAGIDVTSGGHARYENLSVSNFFIGINIQDGEHWAMRGCYVYNTVSHGIKVAHTDLPDGGDWNITDSWVTAASRTDTGANAIEYISGGGGKIVNLKVNADSGTRYTNGVSMNIPNGVTTVDFLIANSSIENVSQHAISMTTTGSGTFQHINIVGNQTSFWTGTNNSGKAVSIVGAGTDDFKDIIISSNNFYGGSGTSRSAVQLTNCNGVTLVGNRLSGAFTSLYSQTTSTDISEIGGVSDHGALTGLTDDDHTQYLKETDVAAKGDIYAASANDTVGVLSVGSNGQILTADSTQALGVKWATSSAAGGHYEVIISGTAPPVAVTNEAEDDWLYGFVPD